jgi:glycosyltransferase involved in cell wall biosynthesis
MAATTRIIAYCKGLQVNDVKTQVFSHTWVKDSDNVPSRGVVEGIEYFNTHMYKSTSSKIYKVLVDKPLMYIQTIRNIYKSHKEEKFDYILFAIDSVSFMRIYIPILVMLGIKLAFIVDEYPKPIRHLKTKIPYWMKLSYKFYHKMFKFRVLMTQNLQNYYDKEISIKDTHIMSTIVDTHRFDGLKKQEVPRQYMCYMGNFDLKKDNVDNIVEAFALISDKYPHIDLHLYGTPTAKDRSVIEELIKEKKLERRVFIKGRIDYNLVPQVLMNATILVASQPQTKRAEGGFPTKMGEYMMTGNPVVLNDVGEIHLYIQDGKNAYMVSPHDSQAYAEKLAYILDNYNEAMEVGARGKRYVLENFSVEKIGEDFRDFLLTRTN